ncbi:MFS transporter [Sulfuriroseicoccus oceanibius]|uniref:MFS transporter n=1 Tax=Sulfuriroseicoccus oceanibius TaxID=2707525 RepID=A0A6B3LF15_9BACT|nr:MFS transporter [Sulfuriroseicoccus oceanibius]QQL45746.1 MFS transporter [Sulfuriroseicoccus oceanibius]
MKSHPSPPEYTSPKWSAARVEILLCILFFFHLGVPGLFTVTLGNVMSSRGLGEFIHLAMSAGPVAAMLAPLMSGALADKRFDLGKVLAVLFAASSITLAWSFYLLDRGAPPWVFIFVFFIRALFFTPTFGLIASLAFALLGKGDTRFPRVRLWGTFGWIAAGWTVSHLLHGETSVAGGYAGAVVLAALAIACWFLPAVPPQAMVSAKKGLTALFGLDAFSLLRNRDHRAVFLTTTLVSIPFAAFYPYTPILLRELGDSHPASTMTLGQVSEIVAMISLPMLVARVRMRWIFLTSLSAALIRYILFTVGSASSATTWLWVGIFLHGICYTGVFITAQMYLADRIAPSMRSQAQSLLVMLNGGVGTLIGMLVGGELFKQSAIHSTSSGWSLFWGVQSAMIAATLIFFLIYYRGKNAS